MNIPRIALRRSTASKDNMDEQAADSMAMFPEEVETIKEKMDLAKLISKNGRF